MRTCDRQEGRTKGIVIKFSDRFTGHISAREWSSKQVVHEIFPEFARLVKPRFSMAWPRMLQAQIPELRLILVRPRGLDFVKSGGQNC